MVTQRKTLINGIDVQSYLMKSQAIVNIDIDQDKATAKSYSGVTEILNIQENQNFELWVGKTSSDEKRIFKGYVNKYVSSTNEIVINALSDYARLSKKEINKTYDVEISEEQYLYEVLIDIIEGGGLTANVTPSDATYTRLEYINEKRSRAAKDIAETLVYDLYFDHHNGVVVAKPKASVPTGVNIEVGQLPLMNIPQLLDDTDKVFNSIRVEGAELLVGKTQWFNGDGNETTFTLDFSPRAINAVWSGTNNFKTTRPTDTDLQTGGNANLTISYDYTWKENTKDVIFQSGSIPSSGTYNIQVDYSYPESQPIIVNNNESINYFRNDETGDDGIRETSIVLEGVKTIEDAEEIGNSVAQEFGFKKTKGDCELFNDYELYDDMLSIDIGETISYVDTKTVIGRDQTFTVRKIVYNYPEMKDVITIGDRLYEMSDLIDTMEQRIKRLEEKNKNYDITNRIEQFEAVTELLSIFEVYESAPEAGVLYWDDDNQGDWDDFNWGDDDEEPQTLIRRLHTVTNTYYEDMAYDNVLDRYGLTDAANTTATVSDGNISFTSGEVWMSSAIFLNNLSYTNIRWGLSDVEVTGLENLTFYASGDGKTNWIEVTLDTIMTFANTSIAGVFIKIEASDTASLEFLSSAKPKYWKIEVDVGA